MYAGHAHAHVHLKMLLKIVNDESFVNLFVFVVDSIIQLLLTIILGVGAGSLHFATCNSHALVVLVGFGCSCEGS